MNEIIEVLKNTYPEAKCSLDFTTPFELVIAVMLSAQCTDARVNTITPLLFDKYNTPEKMAKINISRLEQIIKPCGFYKVKAANAKACAIKIINTYNGIVPNTIEDLTTLPGIGRKSANVIMLEAFDTPIGIAIDTHAKRVSTRLNLTKHTVPLKIEYDLLKLINKKYIKDVNHLFVWHGRYTCTARNPKCVKCSIKKFCKFKV